MVVGRAYLRPAKPALVGLLVKYGLGSSSKRNVVVAAIAGVV